MHFEQVPVGADAAEHLIEEVVKVLPQRVPYLNDMVAQGYLMFLKITAYLALHETLADAYLFQALLNLLLQRCLEVQLVDAIQRHDWMQQVVRVETFSANLLLTLEAEQYVLLLVLLAGLRLNLTICINLVAGVN